MKLTSALWFVGVFAGLVLSLQAVALSGQSATTLYAAHTLPTYAEATGQRIIGSLTPGTSLQVSAGATNGFQASTLGAWSQQGDPTTLYSAQGQRIVLARLTDGAAYLRTLSTVKDDYGNVWNQVELSGFVRLSGLISDQDTIWAQARALYGARCGTCHALHRATEFTANQWPAIIKAMATRASLQPDQIELITQYLQTHSRH